ncbi:MAG TPA: hypothetical protein VM165_13420 [Planctomycetaceae bacterium]|nr:hypothetical protein [Planctomycetaceae bacterium]
MISRWFLSAMCGTWLLVAGCAPAPQPPAQTADHSVHEHSHSHPASVPANVVFENLSGELSAGQSTPVTFHLEQGGERVGKLEPTHEKLMHLILVREALDQFLHLHPTVSDNGQAKIDLSVPEPGLYHVYVDYKPMGGQPGTARTTLTVAGDSRPAAELKTTAPGEVVADELSADIAIAAGADGKSQTITFRLKDRQTADPVKDLEPYLGAMGHLVVIQAATKAYIHAHPEHDTGATSEVAFEVHPPASGQYAGWAQFQRGGAVVTVPFVFDVP